ncbi:Hypothetical protein LUCI_4670 [Lucifera butyrica]|uniref:HTH cro/C1-type domain-containing protein n=1 Tax=Lucifera butyrica TaxID=1351585 RepID=A0A498REZ2_9FIRM|nr:helix-turn-helix domain-containing protein [Lucifera butyrica]VBB09380.1 Hypothetical protein LUCI_4670 [Lucifera butyrica]
MLSTADLNFEAIGARIRQARGTLSQTAFGDSIGASRGYVNNIEHGAKPSVEFLVNVALTYGISTDWLLFGRKVEVLGAAESAAPYESGQPEPGAAAAALDLSKQIQGLLPENQKLVIEFLKMLRKQQKRPAD